MKIFPAIDIKDGQCVRLKQGRFEDKEVFSDDPVSVARKWSDAGAEIIHVVDLDGALAGKPVNLGLIREILAEVKTPLQVGGGIRDFETIAAYLAAGVARVVLGTSAVRNGDLVKRSAGAFPGRIVAGIDAKTGKVAVSGWTDVTDESAVEFGKKICECGISALVYTDIEKDGMMSGPNLARIGEMARAIPVPLVVSGGISTLADIEAVMRIANVEGVIVGRALYTGAVDLQSAIALARVAGC